MFGDDDDGGAFSFGMPSTTGGSKLSSLFGMDQNAGGNESLKYTAPKPPKTKEAESSKQASKGDAPSLLFACACHSFKYLNGEFVKQGKLGAAVLGHLSTKDYKILLYLSQKKPVTNARIHANFQFNVQKNNYASFYDDQSQSWSLCFDNEAQLIDFSKWVALAKFNVQGNMMVTQDLNIIEGQSVEKADTVEMQYTGWLHSGNSFGKVFDSNVDSGKRFKFKVGKGKVIKGWDTGVIGMKKGSKRILIIPPDLAYGSKAVGDRVPPNSTLIFQVEVTRVKYSNPQPDSDAISVDAVDGASKEGVSESPTKTESIEIPVEDNESRERLDTGDNLKERTKSISEQLSKTPENTKSKLLERMSKMGQAMITPTLQKSLSSEQTVESHQEEKYAANEPKSIPRPSSTESQSIPRPSSAESQSSSIPGSPKPQLRPKPEPVPRPTPSTPVSNPYYPTSAQAELSYGHPYQPRFDNNPMFSPQAQLALYQSPQAMQAAMMANMAGLQAPAPIQPQQTSGMSATEMNLMMTDGRLKHGELKTDLTRLMDKIDAMSLKLVSIENLNKQVQPVSQQPLYGPAPEMEANVLMQNITRIIKENDKLRVECEDKTEKIDKLNERMTDLLTKNQHYFEKSNQLIASQTDSMQNNAAQAMAKVSTLEQQNMKLEADLSSLQTQLLHSQTKKEALNQREIELMTTVENLKLELKRTHEKAESANSISSEHESVVDDLKSKLKTEKKEQKLTKLKVETLEEELSEIKLESESVTTTVNDLKKKRKDDKKRYDEELEELKTQHEEELKATRQRYKKDAGSENDKLEKLEEELREQHSDKLRQSLDKQDKKHQEIMNNLLTENQRISQELQSHKNKLSAISDESRQEYEVKLQEKLDELSKLHESQLDECKNEITKITNELNSARNMIASATTMDESSNELKVEVGNQAQIIKMLQEEKNKIEKQVEVARLDSDTLLTKYKDTEEENEKLKNARDEAYEKGIQDGRSNVKTISSASYQKGFEDGKASTQQVNTVASNVPTTPSKEVVNAEVKRIMNSVFQQLRDKFEADESYDGQSVIRVILSTIKDVTLKMVQQDESGEEEEEEEEEESEEEESDMESEEDEEQEEQKQEQEESGEEQEHEGGESEGIDEVDEDELESPVNPDDSSSKVVTKLPEKESDAKERMETDGAAKIKTDNISAAEDTDLVVDSSVIDEVNSKADSQESTVDVESTENSTDGHGETKDDDVTAPDAVKIKDSQETVKEVQQQSSGKVEQPSPIYNESEDEFGTDEGESLSDGDVEKLTEPLAWEHSRENPEATVSNQIPEKKEDEIVTEKSKSPLEGVGIDSSIFGGDSKQDSTSDDENLFTPPLQTSTETLPDDESSLFFGSSTAVKPKPSEPVAPIAEEKKKPILFEEKNKSSLFGDDEDEDEDFFTSKTASKQNPSAFDRSPPPLFEDDDDDVNWI